jgi:hypothetical protein
LLAALLAASASAGAAENAIAPGASLIYGLVGDPAAEQTLFAARWGSSSLPLRFDTAASLGAHELRVLSAGSTARWGSQFAPFGAERKTDLNIDPLRATYRYTLLAAPGWQMKLGLSTNLADSANVLRPALGADHAGFGSLPLLHLAGAAQWSPRWRLAFAVDGLATTRGRAIDLDLQVDYLMTPSVSVFGGYQLTDAAGEAESFYGNNLSNRANIGLRYRF